MKKKVISLYLLVILVIMSAFIFFYGIKNKKTTPLLKEKVNVPVSLDRLPKPAVKLTDEKRNDIRVCDRLDPVINTVQERVPALSKKEVKKARAQKKRQAREEYRRARKIRRCAEKRQEEVRRIEACRKRELQEKKLLEDQITRLKLANKAQEAGVKCWEALRKSKLAKDYEAGRYAYLSKGPYEWPFACNFFSKKDLVEVLVDYQYATDAYNSSGSRVDVSALGPVKVQDILLASKLVKTGAMTYVGSPELRAGIQVAAAATNQQALNTALATILSSHDVDAKSVAAAIAGAAAPYIASNDFTHFADAVNSAANSVIAGDYINSLANQVIKFNGKTQTFTTYLDFARYIWDKKVQFGVQVPIVYSKNTLSCNFPYIRDILKSKGINQLGGSATGLGDVELFASVDIGTRTFKKLIAGLKVILPTGKNASTSQLWGPALGDGYNQLTAFMGMLVEHNSFFNPHVYFDGTYSSPAHFKKRVPVLVTGTVNNNGNLIIAEQDTTYNPLTPGSILNNNLMAKGDSIKIPSTAVPFSFFDSSSSAFADNVHSVRMVPGLHFNIVVGNIIEKVLFRQGFFGFSYNMEAKLADGAHGLDVRNYDLAGLGADTAMMAHKVSANYTYQFDPVSTFAFDFTYTFAGINAPKTFDLSALLSYSF